MTSANQTYKQSGSELPFKEWLKREQLRGKLDVHEDQFHNATGSANEASPVNFGLIKHIAIGAVIGFGVCWYMNKRK